MEPLSVEEYEKLAIEIYQHCDPTYMVVVNGCFDMMHAGHISLLKKAKSLGRRDPILIVGINSDESIRSLKGESRPIISQEERLFCIRELKCVDMAFIFDSVDFAPYLAVTPKCKFVKGGDYDCITEAESLALARNTGVWNTIDSDFATTTSGLVKKIQSFS
jgi:D-beta-D-heptose 7-phosphate kinase/D-beta-D-heptose 1-phosphate adenosyltransferase